MRHPSGIAEPSQADEFIFSALGWNENTPSQQATIATVSRHEFTGHEGISGPGIGFVNMNGRLYIPSGSMFISPDPYIPDPGNTQSFNRYSYVNNNPLTLVDPSGYDPIDGITVIGALGGPENPWADVAGVAVEAVGLLGFSDIFGLGGSSLTTQQRLAQSHGINVSGQIQGAPSFQSLGSTAPLATEDANSTLSEVVVTAHQWHIVPEFIEGFSSAFLDAWISGPHANTELSVSVTRPEGSPDQIETVTINGYRYSYRDDPFDMLPGWAGLRCMVLSNCNGWQKGLAIAGTIPIVSWETGIVRGAAPIVRGGASLTNIGANEALRIQNAASRIDRPITLVGSRAAGTAEFGSDWDYIINGTSKALNSVSSSLPGAGNISEGVLKTVEFARGAVWEGYPSITFFPR